MNRRKAGRINVIALIVAMVFTLIPPTVRPVLAATVGIMNQSAAIRTLQAYGIVDTKPEQDLRLGDAITRAEFAKMLGAALKEQELAKASQAMPAFADTAGNWANGWISVTKARGLFLGREDGKFHPSDNVTYAEVITALLRLTGRRQEAARDWPWGAIFAAAQLDMMPEDMNLEGRFLTISPRGDVFRLMAIAIGRVPLAGTGSTLLQSLHDQTPPVLKLNVGGGVTDQPSILLSGTAGDAVTVEVAGLPAELLPNGNFSAQVSLAPGENVIPVIAMDGAGNRAETTAQVVYDQLVRMGIEPTLIETAVSGTFTPTVLRYDSAGHRTVVTNATWGYDTGAFTRNAASGAFTAKQPGEYTLRALLGGMDTTVKVVVAGEPAQLEIQVDHSTLVPGGAPEAVRVRVLDAQGRLSPGTNQAAQLSVVPAGAGTLDTTMVTLKGGKGVAYLTPGQAPGGLGIRATITGAKPLQSPLMPVTIEQRRVAGIQLQPVPANVEPVAGRTVRIIATAVDQTGAPVPALEDLTFSLASTTPSVLGVTNGTVIIRAGTSSSDFGGQNGTATTGGSSGSAIISGRYATVPVVTTKVTAARSGATATLDLQVLQQVAKADDLSAAVVSVTRLDASGTAVSTDVSPVVMMPGSTGVSITPISDAGGIALFAVRSSAAGRVSVTAGLPGRPEMNSVPAELAFVSAAGAGRAVVVAGSMPVKAGDSTTISVALLSPTGQPIANPGPPLIYQLQSGPGGTLSRTSAVIPSGATRSEPVVLNVGPSAASFSVSASLVGGKTLQPLQLTVQPRPNPPPDLPGNRLLVQGPDSARPAVAGEEVRFLVQARNGGTVQNDAYAFKVRVKLNGQVLTTLPSNLQVSLGRNSVESLTARTVDGRAEIWVRYYGVGTIDLETVTTTSSVSAVDQYGATGSANATTGYAITSAKVQYLASPLNQLIVTTEPNLGGSTMAILKASKGRTATIRVKPVDIYGNSAGESCVATLTNRLALPAGTIVIRSGQMDALEKSVAIGSQGYADFTIATVSDAEAISEWLPTVVCGSTTLISQTVRIVTTNSTAVIPQVEFIGGDLSGAGQVRKADTYLNVRLARSTSPNVGAELLVYDGERLVGRFGPFNPYSTDPAQRTVSIPKSALGVPSWGVSLRFRLNVGSDVSDVSSYYSVYITTSQ